jgi:hypothetical protein
VAFCIKCGAKMAEDALLCANCNVPGNSLVPQIPAGPVIVSAQPSHRSLLRPFLWILAGLMVVLAVVAGMAIIKAAQEGVRDGVSKNVGHDEDIKSIHAVIKQDDDLAKSLHSEIDAIKVHNEAGLDVVASLMQNYVDQARQIDTRFCPRDFAEAYYRHISAWADEAEAIRSHPHAESDDEAFVNGFFRGLQGDVGGGADERKAEITDWAKNVSTKESEVSRTWKEVQALAVRYGA